MKKYYVILIITLLTLAHYSCKKDPSAKPTPEVSKIEGTWKVSYTDYDNYVGNKFIESTTKKEAYNSQATFNADGTGVFTSDDNRQTRFHYTFTGSTLKFTNAKTTFNVNNNIWVDIVDFDYTDVKLGVKELTYTTIGSYPMPALYERYIAKVHLVQ